MASYGIGPARLVAAAVEQFADEHGISWPRALAPFAVHLVSLGAAARPSARPADRVYETLREGGVEVLYDDRDARSRGEVRRRGAARLPAAADRRAPLAGVRRDRGPGPPRPRGAPAAAARRGARPSSCGRWTSCGGAPPRGAPPAASAPATAPGRPRRSGPHRSPAAARCGPWTIPNAVGFVRLGLIPVFLVVALSSSDGTSARAAVLFAVIAGGDYARRDPGPRHRPVQPPGDAAGPDHRPRC